MKRENYRRYGFGGPKKITEPQWVKDLPKDDLKWTPEQDMAYYERSSIYNRRGYTKKEWQAECFENFGHCESNPYKAARMRLCCGLIDIICWGGHRQRNIRGLSGNM